ncbi:MAG: hypothetical protein EPO61_14125 [Nitrospirae bacterium]|nr:MAG: hypothetical protein EPO61_14125 [Nitrospirota bacterium]
MRGEKVNGGQVACRPIPRSVFYKSLLHVKIAELKSRWWSKALAYLRQIAVCLCREMTDSSFPEIGRHFGGKTCSITMCEMAMCLATQRL